jgi:hypothetical protein
MALITRGLLGRYAAQIPPHEKSARAIKAKIVSEQRSHLKSLTPFDLFLSHKFSDYDDELAGMYQMLSETFGFTVFVDHIEYPQLDRSDVTLNTVDVIRANMDTCDCLLYATTSRYSESVWMPWELGYFDGKKGKEKVAILPVVDYASEDYDGSEYLGVYPYISYDKTNTADRWELFVNSPKNNDPRIYCTLKQWVAGRQPYLHSM